ncbi:MAG: B12-binding domain-containing radical SAM protein [Candidatus Acidiferrales bacterium]
MKVGILDILAMPARSSGEAFLNRIFVRQYASLTPQAVSVWCRQLGHQTFYATYYGVGDLAERLPRDLDVVFLSCYTQASALAYALAKLYRRAGTRTVIGGPHAKSFPLDCRRFFDVVVKECDKNLVADILAGGFEPGSVVSSPKPFDDLPPVEERMPEIRTASFLGGRHRYFMSAVPILASVGCPYTCDFCIDWNNPYRLLSTERLAADLSYLAKNLPGAVLAFHDPNFAIKFDEVMDVLEAVPRGSRPPYVMESSLSILRGGRVKRLKETNCIATIPGIESWMDYSNKVGLGRTAGRAKVEQVVEHLRSIHENVDYIQGNFIFGLDTDQGNEPVELTKEFMERAPFVWPALNIPVPFGGTPLHDKYLAQGRILKALPFAFYYAPYIATTLKNYDPISYYEKLIEMFSYSVSWRMLRQRVASAATWKVKLLHWARTRHIKADMSGHRRILQMLRSDSQFRAYHEGRSDTVPEFYRQEYKRMLGPYAELLSGADRTPAQPAAPAVVAKPGLTPLAI